MNDLRTKAPAPTNCTSASKKDFFNLIQTIVKVRFPVQLGVKNHPDIFNILKVSKDPIKKKLIFSTMRVLLFVKAIIVVFCGLIERPSVLHHLLTHLQSPQSFSHDATDNIYNLPLTTMT